MLAAGGAAGQQAGVPEARVNYGYTLGTGWDAFHVEGRSVQLYRLPFSYRLRSLEKGDAWGLKLSLPVSFGFHDFKVTDVFGNEVTEKLETVTVVPGAQFEVPAGQHWTLKPFGELGAGKDLAGGDTVSIYSAGLRTLAVWPRQGHTLSFGSGLDYSGSTTLDGGGSDGFGTLEAGVDVLRPLGVSLGDHAVDASVFLIARRFFDLEFVRPTGDVAQVEYLYEVGVTFGTEPRFTLWKFKMSRLGLSYRFGGPLTSWRINFGFPF